MPGSRRSGGSAAVAESSTHCPGHPRFNPSLVGPGSCSVLFKPSNKCLLTYNPTSRQTTEDLKPFGLSNLEPVQSEPESAWGQSGPSASHRLGDVVAALPRPNRQLPSTAHLCHRCRPGPSPFLLLSPKPAATSVRRQPAPCDVASSRWAPPPSRSNMTVSFARPPHRARSRLLADP